MATINHTQNIFIQEALQAFVSTLTPLNAFSRSYSGETAQAGSAIIVPRVEPLTATTFAYTTNSSYPYENGGGTINTITVSLDQHKVVTVDITDIQASTNSPALLSNFFKQQGKALGKLVLQTLWAGFLTTNFGEAVASGVVTAFGKTKINDARRRIVQRNVPTDMLSLIVNPVVHQALLDDSNITQAYAFGGPEAIREARIPRLLGMDVFESTVLASNSISLVGMLVHPDSLAIALRALQPQRPEAYSRVQVATDDESGISMTYREHFNPGRGRLYASMECVFGSAVGLSLGAGLFVQTD